MSVENNSCDCCCNCECLPVKVSKCPCSPTFRRAVCYIAAISLCIGGYIWFQNQMLDTTAQNVSVPHVSPTKKLAPVSPTYQDKLVPSASANPEKVTPSSPTPANSK